MESSLQRGNFPALAAFAKQATASNNSNNEGNHDSGVRYHKKPIVACISSPAKLPPAENQPGSPQSASAPSYAPTAHTATIEPVLHVTPA